MRNVGLDIGFGNCKVYDQSGSTMVSSQIASITGSNTNGESSDGTYRVSFGGNNYAVGRYAFALGSSAISQNVQRLLGSTEVRSIMYAAMGAHFKGKSVKDPLNVYIGLPSELLREPQKSNAIASVKEWLQRPHEWLFDGKPMSLNIESVTVRSQASGALGDMIHNLQGQQTKEAEYLDTGIGVIAIGMNTVEASGVLLGRGSDTMIDSKPLGVRNLIERCSPPSDDLGYNDELLRLGRLTIADEVRTAWIDAIVGMIETRWAAHVKTLSRLLLVGGGAQYAEAGLRKRYGNRIYMPQEAFITVARGLYKWSVANAQK